MNVAVHELVLVLLMAQQQTEGVTWYPGWVHTACDWVVVEFMTSCSAVLVVFLFVASGGVSLANVGSSGVAERWL